MLLMCCGVDVLQSPIFGVSNFTHCNLQLLRALRDACARKVVLRDLLQETEMVKLDPKVLRYLTKDDFRVLTAIEMVHPWSCSPRSTSPPSVSSHVHTLHIPLHHLVYRHCILSYLCLLHSFCPSYLLFSINHKYRE